MSANAAALLALALFFGMPFSPMPVSLPSRAPSVAAPLSQTLVSFSIEGDRWADWAGSQLFMNALTNLAQRTGQPPRVRIGADSEDHLNFNAGLNSTQAVFSGANSSQPYPEAASVVVGQAYYDLASALPRGTQVTWGVNFGGANMTATALEAAAIARAFAAPAMKNAGVALQALEVGNEPDEWPRWNHALRAPGWGIADYVNQWATYAANATGMADAVAGYAVPLQGLAFAFQEGQFTVPNALNHGLLGSAPGKQIKWISQHHYSGSFCQGSGSVLQDLMQKAHIRGNLSRFADDAALVKSQGLTYELGETNSFSCHGAPGVSDTAGAALWAIVYALQAPTQGIGRLYFHHGVGFKYNFIQPVALTRDIRTGANLSAPLAPHIQPAYHAALLVAEAIGSSGQASVYELGTAANLHVAGYAIFEGGALARAVFVHLMAYEGGGAARDSVHINPQVDGGGLSSMTIKRLSIPTADATSGVTWGGQSFETPDALPSGTVQTQTTAISDGFDISATEAVLLTFS